MATQVATLARPGARTSTGVMLPAFTLWWREIVRFYRQTGRVIGVLASPLVFWAVLGSGFGTSFRSGGGAGQQHYLDYSYPGILILIVLFTSIFTMMSVIEDRKEGFLLSGPCCSGPAHGHRIGQGFGRHYAGGRSGHGLPRVRAICRSPYRTRATSPGRCRRIPRLVFADRAGIRDCMAHGFFPGLSRDRELIPDSALAGVRCAIPALRSVRMDSHHHAPEPANVRSGGASRIALSRGGNARSHCLHLLLPWACSRW